MSSISRTVKRNSGMAGWRVRMPSAKAPLAFQSDSAWKARGNAARPYWGVATGTYGVALGAVALDDCPPARDGGLGVGCAGDADDTQR